MPRGRCNTPGMCVILKICLLLASTSSVAASANENCKNQASCANPRETATASVLLQREVSSQDTLQIAPAESDLVIPGAFGISSGSPFNASKALSSFMALASKPNAKSNSEMNPEMKAIVDLLIAIINKTETEDAYKKSLAADQDKITSKYAELKNVSDHLKTSKENADSRDESLVSCLQSEKDLLEEIKTCADDAEKKKSESNETCAKKDAAHFFKVNLTGSCDIKSKDCAPMMTRIKDELKALESTLATRKEEYAKLEAACNETQAKQKALEANCTNKTSEFLAKGQDCLSKEKDATLAKCSYGTHVQEFCSAVTQAQELIAEIIKSDQSRQVSWASMDTLECVLKKMIVDGHVDEAAQKECADKVDYPRDIGTLDPMEDAMSSLDTSVCSESTVTFSGFQWDVPTPPRGPKTDPDGYIKNTASPTITLTPLDASPFAFCSGSSNATLL